MTSNQS